MNVVVDLGQIKTRITEYHSCVILYRTSSLYQTSLLMNNDYPGLNNVLKRGCVYGCYDNNEII